jgi:hypothetical protein
LNSLWSNGVDAIPSKTQKSISSSLNKLIRHLVGKLNSLVFDC